MTYSSTRRATLAAVALFSAFAFAGCMMSMPVPEDLDLSTTRTGEHGIYQATIQPEASQIPINQIHSWTVQLKDAAGHPVDAARIEVDGDMPQHLHGLPTRPQITEALGDGRYRVEGLKFHMRGWWTVSFKVHAAPGDDEVTFNLML
ncbi:MAG: FixH family protein [Steroidobacteraceae bacterium]|nr:FixH family protein [Steroidobacteraceae bacterium]